MLQKKDLWILSELRVNSRESLTNISKNTGVPISTIFDKLKCYQESLITKHTTLLDFSKLGFNARANIMIKVDRMVREEVRKILLNNLNVNSVYKISNGFDFMIEGIFKNVKDVEEFIDYLGSKFKMEKSEVYYIVEDIRKEDFMNNKETLDMVI